jgi:hypothetical protein
MNPPEDGGFGRRIASIRANGRLVEALIPARDDRNSCVGGLAPGSAKAGPPAEAEHLGSGPRVLASWVLINERWYQRMEGAKLHPKGRVIAGVQLLEGASGVFGAVAPAEAAPILDVKTPRAKIGELTLGNDPPRGLRGPTGATVPAPMSGALGPRQVRCRAQDDDRPRARVGRRLPGEIARHQPGQRLLPRRARPRTPISR